jgi:arginine repressor
VSAATIKAYRQRLIMQVLGESRAEVQTQTELVRLLEAKGIVTTQGAIARDLAQLPVVQYKGRWLTVARFLAVLEAEPRADILQLLDGKVAGTRGEIP